MLTDLTDFVNVRPGLKRIIKLPFDKVRIIDDEYTFYQDQELVCSIRRNVFSKPQQDFFDAISEPV